MLTHQRVATPPIRLLQSAQRLTLDHLWVLTVLALAWLFISVLPLPPNDLWWHMEAGRTMVAERAWIQNNRWAYTVPFDTPYVYQSWLSEIIMYGLWWLGDVPLLTLTRTLVIISGYGLVAWHALRRTAQGKAVALALLLAVLIGWNNWTLRPQTLALLPGAAFVVLIGEFRGGRMRARWLALLPLLMAFWVNMHGSFIMGAILLALVWLGTLWTLLRSPSSLRSRSSSLWHELRTWTAVGLATLAALLLNPLGFGIFGYLRMMMSNSSLNKHIAEWQPLTNEINLSGTGFWFYALLLLLAALMASGPRRPSATDLLWYCGLAWMGISAGRHAMWFALFLLPLVAEQLTPLFASRPAARGNGALNLGYGLLLGGAIAVTLPWFTPGRYLGPDAAPLFAHGGSHHLLLGNMTPLAATEWLEQNPIDGRFWTDISYSSYTIWRMPEKQVFTDLRIELFPEAIWQDYFEIAEGKQASLALLDTWQITHLLLDSNGQADLQQRLAATPGWCERYRDHTSVIMARCP